MTQFTGTYYKVIKANGKLKTAIEKVYDACNVNRPVTLAEVSSITGVPEASVSAAIRSLRKSKYGAHNVETTHVSNGLHSYKLTPNLTGEVPSPTIDGANEKFFRAVKKYNKAYVEWQDALKSAAKEPVSPLY